MSKPDVDFIQNYEWEALYINGILVDEGHSLNVPDVLRHLARCHAILYRNRTADEDWLLDQCSFPRELSKVTISK